MKYYQRLYFNEAGEAKYRTNNNFILALPATHVSRQILTRYLYGCIFTFRAEFFCRIGRGWAPLLKSGCRGHDVVSINK